MPLRVINYEKTHFYKLVCCDTNIKDCFVGHTTDFNSRKNKHKSRCCNPNDKKHHYNVYTFIRANGGWKNWEMILLKTENCENGMEARSRERYYKEQQHSTLNQNVPSRTKAEYREVNKDKYKAYNKQYAQDHKEELAEYHKKDNDDNKELINEKSKERHNNDKENINKKRRQRRKDNPEKAREQDKKAYQRNKEQKLNRAKEQIECECGSVFCRGAFRRHEKSKKHQQYLQNQNNPQE